MKKVTTGPLITLKMAGGGKVDKTKRALLGLGSLFKPTEQNLPVPKTNLPVNPVQPQVTSSPLIEFAKTELNKPMSRRQFLDNTAKTIASQTMRGVLPVAAKKAVTKALPSVIDEEAAADKIADYVAKIWGSSKAANKAFQQAFGQKPKDYFEYDDVEKHRIWQALGGDDVDTDLSELSRSIGLDADTVSAKTGLPIEIVRKLAGEDGNLLDDLIGSSQKRSTYEDIIEDGRTKEARRSTSYLDIFDDDEFLNQAAKNAIKEAGPDADDFDVMDILESEINNKWKTLERYGDQEENKVRKGIYNRVMDDDTLDSVWEQATDTSDADHHEFLVEILERNGFKFSED